MLQFIIISLCVSTIFASKINPVIFNGNQATEGQFPYQAGLSVVYSSTTLFCSGTIISEDYILTQASCLNGDVYYVLVSTGSLDPQGGRMMMINSTSNFIIHEQYDPFTLSNDIALIKLSEPLTFDSNTAAVTLAGDPLGVNVEVTVSGWGLTNNNETTLSNMSYGNLVTISNSDCIEVYETDLITDEVVCTVSGPDNVAPCLGDNGAPVVINADTNPILVAFVIFVSALGCGVDYPHGNVRVAYFKDWIVSTAGL